MDYMDNLAIDPTIAIDGADMMAEVPLEAHDLRQLKLWRKIIYDLHDKYGETFEEYGLGDELRDLLNSLDDTLNILSTKAPYELKITKTKEFMDELERFRMHALKHVGIIANQLCKDIEEEVFFILRYKEADQNV
jgi:methionyl-tRNA synthetase